jgi:uncharacterized SAM-binding protein YcdF (DUF218 family)
MRIFSKKSTGLFYLIGGMLSFINGIASKICTVGFANFFLVLSIPLVALGIYELWLLNQNSSKLLRLLVSLIHICTFLVFISFIILETLIISSSFSKETNKPDYIVVLGAGIRGVEPSHALYKRLEKSLDLINTYKDIKVVVSGGQGPGESIPEAEAMKRYLVSNGVSPERIIKEEKSTNTFENLKFTKAIIDPDNKNVSITIVTSNFHILRSKLLASRFGFVSYGYSSKILPQLIPTYFVREYIALLKSFIFDIP